ncbi:hypothetical protein K435DRAFT_972013 [Dendrothele bispora CBS 962.96]|uniref:Phospholipid/glycerol acyltransferase domain-containing protein n=1 Tax=Dendrothele bispora (strain CBS 962.96) TaxID=1314807 RepID=A0A4S8L1X6_DENBC|nr:hypothetical protein K435DRAFT_972013 [Dendrothele bispora CBS 962.96]
MVELKLVYRFLRKVSDWTIAGYYADVLVVGSENIPKDCPVVIASTHHNEMIDIATLAATIPHRRYLSFWAKASMFAHPVTNFVMSSVGAIPVNRNPNKEPTTSTSTSTSTSTASLAPSQLSQSSLFLSTSETLASNGIVGVFLEGTSYTQPKIVQVMSGAAWAAVEFLKWQHENENGNGSKESKELLVIPVGIVYTDKSRYMSRVRIEYGRPIPLESFKSQLFPSPSVSVPSTTNFVPTPDAQIVKRLVYEISDSLFQITINAEDWETLYSANMARQIMWGDDDRVPLKDWVEVGQTLLSFLSPTPDSTPSEIESIFRVKHSLTKYFSLLHYSSVSHATLERILPYSWPNPPPPYNSNTRVNPNPNPSLNSNSNHIRPNLIPPTRLYLLQTLIHTLPPTFLSSTIHLILLLPTLPMYIPAYVSSHLVTKLLATPGEEEGVAQFMGVGGGLGRMGTWAAGYGAWVGRMVVGLGLRLRGKEALTRIQNVPILSRLVGFLSSLSSSLSSSLLSYLPSSLSSLTSSLSSFLPSSLSRFLRTCPETLKTILLLAVLETLLVKWYHLWIREAYKLFQDVKGIWRLNLLWALVRGPERVWGPAGVSGEKENLREKIKDGRELRELERYMMLPPPPENAFIRKRKREEKEKEKEKEEGKREGKEGNGVMLNGNSSSMVMMNGKSGFEGKPGLGLERTSSPPPSSPPPPVSITRLITPLLYAREEAKAELGRWLRDVERKEIVGLNHGMSLGGDDKSRGKGKGKVEWLRNLGAEIPGY